VDATLTEAKERMLRAYRADHPLVLLFDYDGTLVPIVEHPSLATLAPRTRDLLDRLARRPRVFLGILSGRKLSDLEQLVGFVHVFYAGAAGLELNLRGTRTIHPRAEKARALIEELCRRLQEALTACPGSCVENKQFGLTIHYRAAAPAQIPKLRALVAGILQPRANELRILEGPMAIEATLALGWTKGTAVRMIAENVGPGAFPLYAGDEANDRDALEAATALGGIALGIGSRAPSTSECRLPDPAALVQFLAELLESLDAAGHQAVPPA